MSDGKKSSNKGIMVAVIVAAAVGYMFYARGNAKSVDIAQLTQSWNCEEHGDDNKVTKKLFRFGPNGEYSWRAETSDSENTRGDVVTVSGEYKLDGNKIVMDPMYATSRNAERVGIDMTRTGHRGITHRESTGEINQLDRDALVMDYVSVNTKYTTKTWQEHLVCQKSTED